MASRLALQSLTAFTLPQSQPHALTRRSQRSQRRSLQIVAVGWDPEGILAAPQPGHISRRRSQKQMADDGEEQRRVEQARREEGERRRVARMARAVPSSPSDLIEFLLNTEVPDMEPEIARCRPMLNAEFFATLRSATGAIRFAARQTEADLDRLAELEALEKVVMEGVEAYDQLESAVLGARSRLSRLMASKDKRAELLAMAAADELDRDLLTLLDQNIAAAAAAEQKEAVEFMEKLRGGVVKYMVKS